jgi:hypothetical protein
MNVSVGVVVSVVFSFASNDCRFYIYSYSSIVTFCFTIADFVTETISTSTSTAIATNVRAKGINYITCCWFISLSIPLVGGDTMDAVSSAVGLLGFLP